MVGDYIGRFIENDMVLIGSNLPHEYLCDSEFFNGNEGFKGEGLVIQFLHDFLGKHFFDIPENYKLKSILAESLRGIEISGESKNKIKYYMNKMLDQSHDERLFSLFSIFEVLTRYEDQNHLSSPASLDSIQLMKDDPMRKALDFILQNYHKYIEIKDLLEITNMSNTAFYAAFKRSYRMSFKSYLLQIRIGYACRLLTDGSQTISEIAYDCGFENISNFNRQFKKIKGITPSEFQERVNRGMKLSTLCNST